MRAKINTMGLATVLDVGQQPKKNHHHHPALLRIAHWVLGFFVQKEFQIEKEKNEKEKEKRGIRSSGITTIEACLDITDCQAGPKRQG